MTRATATIGFAFVLGGALFAQAPARTSPDGPSFEVASIRPTQGTFGRGLIDVSIETTLAKASLSAGQNGRYRATAITPYLLIQLAYDVKDYQIADAPPWIRNDRYAIDATAPAPITTEAARAMLRSLLIDRFHLTVRREARDLPAYELIPAGDGLKITPMKDGECVTFDQNSPIIPMDPAKPVYVCGGFRRRVVTMPPDRTDRVEAGGITMNWLVDLIAEDVGRPVVDRTGFAQPFNLVLDFAPVRQGGVAPVVASAPTIFGAVEEQLGVRLRSTTASVETLVIERIERPSAN